MEIEVGRGLAALDMLAAAVDVVAERIGQPEMGEMVRDPAVELDEATALGRSGGSDRTKSTAPATARDALAKRARSLCSLRRSWNSGGSGAADPALDRGDELRPAEADVMFDAPPRRWSRWPRSVSSSAS